MQIDLKKLAAEIRSAIGFKQPKLTTKLYDDKVVVRGKYLVYSDSNVLKERGLITEYEIEIKFLMGFPVLQPKVYEIGNRIKHDIDHHFYSNGSCCIGVWGLLKINSVKEFFERPLKNYFLGQYYFETTGKYPFGEVGHRKCDLISYYAEEFECEDNESVVIDHINILIQKSLDFNTFCPCRSGNIVEICCKERIIKLREWISIENAVNLKETLNIVNKYQK